MEKQNIWRQNRKGYVTEKKKDLDLKADRQQNNSEYYHAIAKTKKLILVNKSLILG